MQRLLAFALVAASALATARNAHAQSLSIEATAGMGLSSARAGYAGSRSGLAVGALLSMRLRPAAGGRIVAGIGASAQGTGANAAICRPSAADECMPTVPGYFVFAPLIGWETDRSTVRAMVGPAYIQPTRGDGHALGLQGRLDMVPLTIGRAAIVASIRPALVLNHRSDTVGLLAFGPGLRIG